MDGDGKNVFVRLQTNLTIFANNVKMLHWNCKGNEFGAVHDGLTNDLYDKMTDDIDRVAEMMIRLSIRPLNLYEVVQIGEENDIPVVSSNYLYQKEDVYKYIQKMLIEIIGNIEEALQVDMIQDVKNTGIRSDLEAMHNEYDIERRFKNARRMLND